MLQYFIIQTLLYVICTYLGYRLSKKNENKYFWMMVITFTLVWGLRFGRGVDYNVYITVWDDIKNFGIYSNPEAIVFNSICWILQSLGLPYQSLIVLCSFILAYCGFTFLRRYRECLILSVPLFLFFTVPAQTLFRWWTGFAFILLGICYFLDGKKLKFWIFSFIGCGIHFMLILIVPIIYVLLARGEKMLLRPWTAVMLSVIVAITWNASSMLFLDNILHKVFGNSAHYAVYLDRSTDLLSGQWSGEKEGITFLQQTRVLLQSAFYLVVGGIIIKAKPHLTPYYNILVVASILNPIDRIEMIGRFIRLMSFFQCILGSYCFIYVLKRNIKTNMVVILLAITLLVANGRLIIKENIEPDKWRNMYLWDANGLRYVPLEYWLD